MVDERGEPAKLRDEDREAGVPGSLNPGHECEQFRRNQLVFRNLGSYLKSALAPLEVHAAIECFGPQIWPEATGAVYLHHNVGGYLDRVAGWGDATLNKKSIARQDCWALRRSRAHCIRGPASGLLCAHISQPAGALPSLCVPLMAQGEMLGLFHLQGVKNLSNASRDGTCADPDLALAAEVAEDLCLALANIRLQESLREQSIRDPLTGLFNRRFVDEYLAQELARAQRMGRMISMVTLDIDHFKRINDTFGHSAGDTVLKKVSAILREHVRGSDIASRIGGEEFLLLLTESPLRFATKRANDIRTAIHAMSLWHDEKPLGPITASFGAAAYPDHGRTPYELFRAADEALYSAKNGGRNKVVSAPQLQ